MSKTSSGILHGGHREYLHDSEGYVIISFAEPIPPEEEEECVICLDEFTRRNPKIECPFCTEGGEHACKSCVKEYHMHSVDEHFHCLICKKDWQYKFVYKVLEKTFIDTKYRDHLKDVLLEKEKARIPETLAVIQQEREREDLLRDMRQEYEIVRRQAEELYNDMIQVRGSPIVAGATRTTFVCRCPIELCKGMIESRTKKCVVCNIKICKDCRLKLPRDKDEAELHVCVESDIETVKLLQKDTKACPKCATLIFKVSGCDQMWCTECQTAFSWRSGKVVTGTIHNPHYYQFMRDNGQNVRNINDIPCGGLIDAGHVTRSGYDPTRTDFILRIHRLTGEIDYKLQVNRVVNGNAKFRRDYVESRMNERTWRQKLFNQMRNNSRRLTKQQIYTTLRTVLIERLREVASPPYTMEKYRNFVIETEKLRVYVNKCLSDEVKYLGGNVIDGIAMNWTWTKIKTHVTVTRGIKASNTPTRRVVEEK